ncbi:MAG: HAD-IA family hydrolase [Ferrimonas sp.]
MQFYRRLHPIQAISFDLDDTLYANGPILQHAEQQLLHWLSRLGSAPQLGDERWWLQQKRWQQQNAPELMNDPTALRLRTLQAGLTALHIEAAEAKAQLAMAAFLQWRNAIVVMPEIIALLQALARRYALAVITNGNADVQQFLPQVPFQVVLAANATTLAKPASQMFEQCCQQLNVVPSALLHVGDHPVTDVMGAQHAGCQSAWLTSSTEPHFRLAVTTLPTLVLTDLLQLQALL